MIPRSTLVCLLAWTIAVAPNGVGGAFSSALFQAAPAMQKTSPSKTDGVDIELPDFDELFGRIEQVSPLARTLIKYGHGKSSSWGDSAIGFMNMDELCPGHLEWKTVECNQRHVVHQIDKIENFNGHNAPLLRFRSSMNGPCVGECFGNYIMCLEERRKWDTQIEKVYEIHPIHDLDAANIAMGFGRYGDCSRLGVGYCQTKANLGITPREQLTLCGIQDFANGSCLIWGTEMQEWHNHLLPEGPRYTRAKSHIFSTALVPTGPDSFDVEYVLQLEVGGKLPTWLTTPIMIDNIKRLFHTASAYYSGKDGKLQAYLNEKAKGDAFANRFSLLMTP